MMTRILKHISTAMLLLFVLAIGARSVAAIDVWECAKVCLSEVHHECCDCDKHEHDCTYHDKSLKGSCTSHNVDDEGVAVVVSESKSSLLKRFVLLAYILNLSVDLVESAALFLNRRVGFRVVDYISQWICDIGLLRAPPVC